MTRHIIFDLWGTLADTDASLLSVPRGHLLRFGRDTWMITDTPEESFFSEYAKMYGADEAALRKSFHAMEQSAAWFQGIPELLQSLKDAGCTLHILSNTGITAKQFLERSPESSLFATIHLSCDIGVTKPDTEAYTHVLEAADARPEECVMVGDTRSCDVIPPRELGMQAIHFSGRTDSVDILRQTLLHG